jgi:hypothetical protein
MCAGACRMMNENNTRLSLENNMIPTSLPPGYPYQSVPLGSYVMTIAPLRSQDLNLSDEACGKTGWLAPLKLGMRPIGGEQLDMFEKL